MMHAVSGTHFACFYGLLFALWPVILHGQTVAQPGDRVTVTKAGVQFGIRDQPLLTVAIGTEVHVTELRGNWIGGYMLLNGEKRLGWVHQSEVRLAATVPGPPPDVPDEPAAVEAWKNLGAKLVMNDAGRVQEISPGDKAIGDNDLVHLKGVPNLLSLDLSGQAITDEGLKRTADCQALQKLYLDGTKVSDDGLSALSQLRRLEVLVLSNTPVTGAGASELLGLPTLQVLNLGGCEVTDDDLARLALLRTIEILTLPRTKITDAGLEHLASLHKLRVLNLDGTAVTGSGFEHLLDLSELRMLYVRGCTIDEGAIDKLDDELPGLAIYD